MQQILDDNVLTTVSGAGPTAETMGRNAVTYANRQLDGKFQVGGAGYPADGSKPMNMWTEKGFQGYQVYVHDPHFGGVSVIENTAGKPVRLKWL